jgi:hypothetical protein
MLRTAFCLIIVFCFVSIAAADILPADYVGCNAGGNGSCAGGPFTISTTGNNDGSYQTWTFDYSVPNKDVKQISYLNDVVVSLQVFDTKNQSGGDGGDAAFGMSAQDLVTDGAKEGFKIFLLVGGEDHTTAAYSLLIDTVAPTYLDSYTGTNRDTINLTVTDPTDLAKFLKQLKKADGDFSVEVVATKGDFYLGDRHQDPDGSPARFASLDASETPEPASLGTVGIGLLALCWTLRKKIRKSA